MFVYYHLTVYLLLSKVANKGLASYLSKRGIFFLSFLIVNAIEAVSMFEYMSNWVVHHNPQKRKYRLNFPLITQYDVHVKAAKTFTFTHM